MISEKRWFTKQHFSGMMLKSAQEADKAGRLAQLGERSLDVRKVAGSIPVPSICRTEIRFRLQFILSMVSYLSLMTRFLGQAVKTPPSHGGNRGSIPLGTAMKPPYMRRFFFAFLHEMMLESKGVLSPTDATNCSVSAKLPGIMKLFLDNSRE